MAFKHRLTRALMNRLPPDAQERIVTDLIVWLYPDLPSYRRQEVIDWLRPRLLKGMSEGRYGLPLLVRYHLLRLSPLRGGWEAAKRLSRVDRPSQTVASSGAALTLR
jgi:hypothetical protein